jgi:hypothetical protein
MKQDSEAVSSDGSRTMDSVLRRKMLEIDFGGKEALQDLIPLSVGAGERVDK